MKSRDAMSGRKGITPVIAVILLLLITISMVGFAFVWFTRVATTAQNATESNLEHIISQQSQTIRIDNVDPASSTVTVRDTGNQPIPTTSLQVYVGGVLQTCAWSAGSLPPGSTITCTFGTACPAGSGTTVKVTAPGGPDQTNC